MHLLDLYFHHAGRATYGMFPRVPFLAWVQSNREKNPDHLMVLYSVLAMGSVFSLDFEHRNAGKRYAAIAAYALDRRFGRFTLQLCQSRLMLALYNFARGKSQEAWDYCGAGLRALSALKLNTEDGIKELPETATDAPYGFDRATLEECCRRTFWSGFLMDVSSTAFATSTALDLIHQQRYNGFCGGTLCVINVEDTFLRLPCLENMFEASSPSEAPLFDVDMLSRQGYSGPGTLGRMAYLTLISTIWGDIVTFTSRAVHRPGPSYERVYEAFYTKMYERLDTWLAMLPDNLRVNHPWKAHLRYTLTVSSSIHRRTWTTALPRASQDVSSHCMLSTIPPSSVSIVTSVYPHYQVIRSAVTCIRHSTMQRALSRSCIHWQPRIAANVCLPILPRTFSYRHRSQATL